MISEDLTGPAPGRSTRELPENRLKAIFDIGVAGILLVLASPLILLCLIAVRLGSKGSPIYSQKRLGSRRSSLHDLQDPVDVPGQ